MATLFNDDPKISDVIAYSSRPLTQAEIGEIAALVIQFGHGTEYLPYGRGRKAPCSGVRFWWEFFMLKNMAALANRVAPRTVTSLSAASVFRTTVARAVYAFRSSNSKE